MTIVNLLQFNSTATKALGANTRLRVKPLKRGGVEYVALRPSYRVSGKNHSILTQKTEAGDTIAILGQGTEGIVLPELNTELSYEFKDVGYGWFILKAIEEGVDAASLGVITVTKRDDVDTIAGKIGEVVGEVVGANADIPAIVAAAKEVLVEAEIVPFVAPVVETTPVASDDEQPGEATG